MIEMPSFSVVIIFSCCMKCFYDETGKVYAEQDHLSSDFINGLVCKVYRNALQNEP